MASAMPNGGPSTACEVGAAPAIRHLLYFGRNIPGGGVVEDSALRLFLADEVALRFPTGFTIWDATGHWKGASGLAETERTVVLMLLQTGAGEADSLVRTVARTYKQRFRQEAVLHERSVVCSRLE
jgi:hypothetical protein